MISACFYFYDQRGYIHLYSFDCLRNDIKSAKKIRSDFLENSVSIIKMETYKKEAQYSLVNPI